MTGKKNQYIPPIVFHPGETLAEKLKEQDTNAKEFATLAEIPAGTIIAIIEGYGSINTPIALKFEEILKIPAHFWMNKQRVYDDYLSRESKK
ncbi:MAG: hypothetical protein AMXMBFR48_20780 [Ignavibacteriales bacterium]